MEDEMKIFGYSERGIINALFYEMSYSPQANNLLESFLALAHFPYLTMQSFQVRSAMILIEQSFSDFGDADVVLLIDTGKQSESVFIEAKVKSFQKSSWSIEEEYSKFRAGTKSTVRSSNIFTQLYHKVRLVNGLRTGGINALQAGIPFPKSSSKPTRKIGKNKVVLEAVSRLKAYLDTTYYITLIPDAPDRTSTFFDNVLRKEIPDHFPEWDVTRYGYMFWPKVAEFCDENDLKKTAEVFTFNQGQIYDDEHA